MPIGVVIGPLRATPASRMDASVSLGNGLPSCAHDVCARLPHVPVELTPVASSTRRSPRSFGARAVAGDEGQRGAPSRDSSQAVYD